MYNAQGMQQMYNAQGTPITYTPGGHATPYKTPPLSKEVYGAQGSTILIENFSTGGAAFVTKQAKQKYWEERSVHGFPVGASEWENKAKEKYAWVEKDPTFIPIDEVLPPRVVQDPTFVAHTTPTNFRASTEREQKMYEKPAEIVDKRPNNSENKGCFYTTDGEVSCP